MAAYQSFISRTQPELSRLLGNWSSRLTKGARRLRNRQLNLGQILREEREREAAAAADAGLEAEIAEQRALNEASMPGTWSWQD